MVWRNGLRYDTVRNEPDEVHDRRTRDAQLQGREGRSLAAGAGRIRERGTFRDNDRRIDPHGGTLFCLL
jgi:hypothetical protein